MLVNQGPGIYLMKNGEVDEFCIAVDGTLASKIFNLKLIDDGTDVPLFMNTKISSFALDAKLLDGFTITENRCRRQAVHEEIMDEVFLLHDGWCLYRDKVNRDQFYLFVPRGDFCYFVRQKEKGAKMVAPFCTEKAPCYTNKQGENSSTPLTKTLSFLKTAAGFSTRTTAKLTNYFLVEAAWNVVQRALWSVRYVVMASVVGMSTYGFFNPSAALGLLKSMIPSVSIKVEAPEILK